MTDQEARKIFDQAIEAAKQIGNADAVARIELVREFMTNQGFREALSAYSFEING
mgnify:CR=1 FL=1